MSLASYHCSTPRLIRVAPPRLLSGRTEAAPHLQYTPRVKGRRFRPGRILVMSATPTAQREWTPRLWQGCSLYAWLRLLIRNRCAVGWPYWYIAGVVTNVSICHSGLRLLHDAW